MRTFIFLLVLLAARPAIGQTPYGLWEDQSLNQYFLVSIDPLTGAKTNVGVQSGVTALVIPNTTTINTDSNFYHYRGISGGTFRFFTTDLNSGVTLQSPQFPDNVVGIEYNCANDTLYGLYENNNQYSLVWIDHVTGVHTTINAIPGVSAHVGGTFSLDAVNGSYHFVGFAGSMMSLYNIDLNTGSVISNVPISNNVTGHRFNCNNNTLYGIWEDQSTQLYYLVSVNPLNAGMTVLDTINGMAGTISETASLNSTTGKYIVTGFLGSSVHYFSIDVNTYAQTISPVVNYNAAGLEQANCCFGPPIADFEASDTLIVAGDTVDFTDLSLNNPSIWTWTFSGGSPSTSGIQHPTDIVFNAPGCYDITLIAANAQGADTLTKSCYVVAGSPPVTDFEADTLIVATGDSVNFTDLSTNSPNSWFWTFTGGTPNTSLTQHPSGIRYDSAGCFDVSLTANNAFGSDGEVKTCYILAGPAPVADFTADSLTITTGDSVNYTDLSLHAPVTWSWVFEGGFPTSSTVQHPANIRYDSAGCYTTTLLVSNQFGEDSVAQTCYITVSDPIIPDTIPEANFEADSLQIDEGGSVNFTDLSLYSPTSWSWTFQGGNPASSTAQHPQNIVYDSAGCYDVTLEVSKNGSPNTLTKTCYIQVDSVVTIGMEAIAPPSPISIHPNPIDDRWSIRSTHSQPLRCTLYDLTGRRVQSWTIRPLSTLSLDRMGIPGGIYFYRISEGSGINTSGKLIFR